MVIVKWIKRLVIVLLILVLGFFAYVGVSSKISGEPPKIMGYQLLEVFSGSMEPSIQTGSIILVKQVAINDVFKEGDVITYFSADTPNEITTHRIVGIRQIDNKAYYQTKGDNNDSKDFNMIPSENVIALYQNFTIPYLGYIFNYAASKNGIILLLFIPGLLIIISQIIKLWKMILRKSLDQTDETDGSITTKAN